jgi:NDP-sugar pyrophosphorylase family protein
MKAMVLAAGLGTRLRPLTQHVPKSLIPVCNRPMLVRLLEMLRQQGVTSVTINVHYLAAEVMREIGDGSRFGLSIRYSVESELLGTGGGLAEVAEFLEAESAFFLINSDLLLNLDLSAVLDAHVRSKAVATVVVQSHPEDGVTAWLGIDAANRVRYVPGMPDRGGLRRVLFSGVHVLSPAIFRYLPRGEPSCVLRTGYVRMLQAGLDVNAYEVQPGAFMEVGRPDQFLAATFNLMDATRMGPVLIDRDVALGSGLRLGPYAVIGQGAAIGSDSSVEYSIVLPGAQVPAGTRLCSSIVSKHGTLNVDGLRLPAVAAART